MQSVGIDSAWGIRKTGKDFASIALNETLGNFAGYSRTVAVRCPNGGHSMMTKGAFYSPLGTSFGALRELLEQRFGDGTIYMCNETQRPLLEQAQWHGYVSMDGQITPVGRSFLARCEKFTET